MQFEYEISAQDYSGAQAAYYKVTTGRKRFKNGAFWIVIGLFFISVACNQRVFNWASILLGATGIWWIYCGAMCVFPELHFRRYYPTSEIVGKKFKALVKSDGFEVTGEVTNWRIPWSEVAAKAEHKSGFMLYAAGTVFMFGKKYLTVEQQSELRRLAGLAT